MLYLNRSSYLKRMETLAPLCNILTFEKFMATLEETHLRAKNLFFYRKFGILGLRFLAKFCLYNFHKEVIILKSINSKN